MSRNAVLRGHEIELTAISLNAGNDPEDATGLLISIFPPGKDPRHGHGVADAWVWEASLTSGGTGPYATTNRIIRTAEGHYSYTFRVPDDCDYGAAFDNWKGTVDLQALDEVFAFVIVAGGSIETTVLYNNNIVYITLDGTIADLLGNTLGEDYEWYFTTTYDPLYTSVRKIRLDLGPLIRDIPDDTINLAIFEAGLIADANDFSMTMPVGNIKYYALIKREYVNCLAELMLTRALAGDASLSERLSKTLDNLSITRGGMEGQLNKKIGDLEDCVKKWQGPLQSAGNVTPETSLRPDYAVKGALAEDAIFVSRQWAPTGIGVYNNTPAANSLTHNTNRRMYRTYRKKDG